MISAAEMKDPLKLLCISDITAPPSAQKESDFSLYNKAHKIAIGENRKWKRNFVPFPYMPAESALFCLNNRVYF
jgi:hypothetical protein